MITGTAHGPRSQHDVLRLEIAVERCCRVPRFEADERLRKEQPQLRVDGDPSGRGSVSNLLRPEVVKEVRCEAPSSAMVVVPWLVTRTTRGELIRVRAATPAGSGRFTHVAKTTLQAIAAPPWTTSKHSPMPPGKPTGCGIFARAWSAFYVLSCDEP